jgi:hypothetical protein
MKKCANCGFESPDEALSCPSCSTDAFVATSREALGHIISPEEQRFWERMTFRQFAVFLIRLQAVWLLFYTAIEATYLVPYLTPYVHFTLYATTIVFRGALHLALALICIRYADRIVSWFVKDIIPKQPPNTALEPTAAAPSVSDAPSNPKAGGESKSASSGGGSALDR